ncbi:hypothetical protein SGUI_1697 [Serinicoccus hydrothermalis]|uniref:WXG100 family type VII secretion target n=1 Tax=Serinicoccus hydrothermalis TaxID=1758689 RepID=A0A1B1NCD4_9MICO|nr:WXG100 family type VII secretion target [Serinicoccus hydrothermalis]ANS79093.1 hypothetical protein SGUI_1697 [Serinicoccus hydrothermalis]
MAVGGELATLRDLHKTLDTSAQEIEKVSGDVDKSVQSTVWTGTNAEKFRDAWQTFKPTLTPKLVEAMNEAKEDIKMQHNNLAAATGESDRI